jgi:hypothetical protein
LLEKQTKESPKDTRTTQNTLTTTDLLAKQDSQMVAGNAWLTVITRYIAGHTCNPAYTDKAPKLMTKRLCKDKLEVRYEVGQNCMYFADSMTYF